MRKLILFLIVIFIILFGYIGYGFIKPSIEKVSNDPFRAYGWNTSSNEIKAKSKELDSLTDLDYVIAYENYQLFNIPSQIYFHFEKKKLKEIAYRIKDKEGTLEYFLKIRSELVKVYGQPKSDESLFINKETQDKYITQTKDKNPAETFEILYGMLTNGDVTQNMLWEKNGFSVTLMLSNSGTTKKNITYTDISIRKNGFVFKGF